MQHKHASLTISVNCGDLLRYDDEIKGDLDGLRGRQVRAYNGLCGERVIAMFGCRMQDNGSNDHCHGRGGQADGVDQHYAVKGRFKREYQIYPADAHTAHADHGYDSRDHRDAKAPQIAGYYLIGHAEKISRKDF